MARRNVCFIKMILICFIVLGCLYFYLDVKEGFDLKKKIKKVASIAAVYNKQTSGNRGYNRATGYRPVRAPRSVFAYRRGDREQYSVANTIIREVAKDVLPANSATKYLQGTSSPLKTFQNNVLIKHFDRNFGIGNTIPNIETSQPRYKFSGFNFF